MQIKPAELLDRAPRWASSVQMGVTANQEVRYLGVFTKVDIGLQNGTQSQIFVSIDGHLYSGVATSTSGELRADILAATS